MEVPDFHFPKKLQSFTQPSEDILHLSVQDASCDVILKCGTAVYKAHKVMLCSRSPVFDAMFSHSMKENQDNTVNIDDMKPNDLWATLQCIYGENPCISSNEMACDLLYAAEKYHLEKLKVICCDFLKSHMTNVETTCDVLSAADKYQLEDLKKSCCDFLKSRITQDNALEILATGGLHDQDLKAKAVQCICSCDNYFKLEQTNKEVSMILKKLLS